MIAIIDYGMGNLRSVAKGFEKVGIDVGVTNNPADLSSAGGVVLPGVGAFSDALDSLLQQGMIESIYRVVDEGKPILGICLGLQLLFEASEEWGTTKGLGLLPGRVKKLPSGVKIPHMGWNTLKFKRECPLFDGIPEDSAFYFVHSYFVDPSDPTDIVGATDYGIEFTSVAARNNVFGIQFHPEKSSALGLQILKNFGRLVERC